MKARILFSSLVLLWSCSETTQSEHATNNLDSLTSSVVKKEDSIPKVIVVGEHHVNEHPITDHPTAKPEHKASDLKLNTSTYKPLMASDIHSVFMKSSTMMDEEKITSHPSGKIISKFLMDKTQSYVAFANDKWLGSIAVISDLKSGIVKQIIYTDSTHQDVYAVKPGMTSDQVKALRGEMEFIEHNGSYYLYTEDSNIMYLVDIKNENVKEHDELKKEETIVTAIIWKDKKDSDHPKLVKNKSNGAKL